MGVPMCKPSLAGDACDSPERPENNKSERAATDAIDTLSEDVTLRSYTKRENADCHINSNRPNAEEGERRGREQRGADAGKSTILRQMRILHMNGFSEGEILSFHKTLRLNVFQIFHEIARGVQESKDVIDGNEKSMIYRFSEGHLWFMGKEEETEIEFILNFLQLNCVQYFLKCYPNHPSLPDNSHYRLIDVGGQRTYRKKWIHCFDGVSAVLFVASMAAYDQFCSKKLVNRLKDSADLFGEMLRSRFLLAASFILFLNKMVITLRTLQNLSKITF
ncbi:hypothetical protein PRIPAC_78266 [Pristionchus pacificus]|nr:hypothetical protein PRIPAC_78266 [Pristionchus pacificus]